MKNSASFDSIVVILKVTERCNINCSYCYFFNGIDTSFKQHAARMSLDTVKAVANYFVQACKTHNIKVLRFDFHGGEPLLLKPDYFASICNILIESLSDLTKIEFTLQTNAMLINEKWIALFNHYKINIGISIDGPAEYHDQCRFDHQGRGTYAKTRTAIELLRKHVKKSEIKFGIGALSVINPQFSGRKIYRHLVDDLKLNSFDFLLPDNTWDSVKNSAFNSLDYGGFLSDVYDEWTKDNNPKIYVRILNSIMSSFLNQRLHFHDFGGWIEKFLLVTISSDGDIGPDDTYRSADPKFMQLGLKVQHSSFSDFLKQPAILEIIDSAKSPPDDCQGCRWVNTCRGGALLHRYHSENGFKNRSVYCDGLKYVFQNIAHFIANHQIEIMPTSA